ncbi:Chorion peroxidase [Pseudolycoriella hygida]|uniref:Chorion peroxidase n=1 Tax=Pseudolycoriella hygida TaxID=35572 RepID=A0A9Q0S5R6_9DIPT|nr:Chorion peroxidase [Pseudolycoriella hygida]
MSFIANVCVFLLLVLQLTSVKCKCPYAAKFGKFSDLLAPFHIWNDVERGDVIADDYMSALSYETYQTDCHNFVSQPPSIETSTITNALISSVNQTAKYILLDIEAAAGVSAPSSLTEIDRISYFLESATKYLQETTCSSKGTTSLYLPGIILYDLQIYLATGQTQTMCKNGQILPPTCDDYNLYRGVTGICNNLLRPVEGSVGDCMLRLLPADYKDGIKHLRTSVDGTPLTNPKVISTTLFGKPEARPLSKHFTQFQSFFGEFVIGDSGATLNPGTGMLVELQCCDKEGHPRVEHPQCAPIYVPPDQESILNGSYKSCMQFVRSIPCAQCKLGPRMISNGVTAAQDLNAVYGTSDEMLMARRTMEDGLLKSETINGEEFFAMEKITGRVRQRCLNNKCEASPIDSRNLLTPLGVAFALIFHRNHNRHARNIAAKYPKWNDEKIFQTARRWNIAEYQHLVYSEYLQTLIGLELAEHYGIIPEKADEFSSYKEDVTIKTIIEFQSTAGRHGHATVTEEVTIIEPDTLEEYSVSLRDEQAFESIAYHGLFDGLFLGEMKKTAFEVTPNIPFKTFVETFDHLDLAALDIQRQRDHGIAGYIYYVQHFHDVKIEKWDDLLIFMPLENIELLQKVYRCVEDIELYVGGHYERKVEGAVVGPTFAHIIGIQFHNSKYGDRFFYEHEHLLNSFTIEQLAEIKTKTCFARLLCKNTGLQEVLLDPLRKESHTNKFVSCSEYDEFDYKL